MLLDMDLWGIVFSKNKEGEEPLLLENPEQTSPGLFGLAFLSALWVGIVSDPHDLFVFCCFCFYC